MFKPLCGTCSRLLARLSQLVGLFCGFYTVLRSQGIDGKLYSPAGHLWGLPTAPRATELTHGSFAATAWEPLPDRTPAAASASNVPSFAPRYEYPKYRVEPRVIDMGRQEPPPPPSHPCPAPEVVRPVWSPPSGPAGPEFGGHAGSEMGTATTGGDFPNHMELDQDVVARAASNYRTQKRKLMRYYQMLRLQQLGPEAMPSQQKRRVIPSAWQARGMGDTGRPETRWEKRTGSGKIG